MNHDETTPSLRNQAEIDDARLEARRLEIMTPPKVKASKSDDSSQNPNWLKPKAVAKAPQKPASDKPVRRKKQGVQPKPAKGSDESWKMAAEYAAKKQAEE